MVFLSNLVNGLSLGSVYAIIALGYTMVYGIARMLNFAHGDVIMIGAYISFCSTAYLHLPPVVGLIIAICVCTCMGIMIEGLAYRPLRGTGSLAVLITAIGVSYFLQNSALLMEDNDAARLMGINVNQTISMTFAIGSALAAIAGVLLCSSYPALMPTTGAMPGIKAFTAAVFGGIGSIPGAMLGGILLGVIEIMGRAYVSSELSDAIVFGVLIIVLLVKPSGLLGKMQPEKV